MLSFIKKLMASFEWVCPSCGRTIQNEDTCPYCQGNEGYDD